MSTEHSFITVHLLIIHFIYMFGLCMYPISQIGGKWSAGFLYCTNISQMVGEHHRKSSCQHVLFFEKTAQICSLSCTDRANEKKSISCVSFFILLMLYQHCAGKESACWNVHSQHAVDRDGGVGGCTIKNVYRRIWNQNLFIHSLCAWVIKI